MPAERVLEARGPGSRDRHRVDGEVAPARGRPSRVSPKSTVGLAGGGVVGLRAVRRDLDLPRRPCGSRWCRTSRPMSQTASAQPAQQPLGGLRARGGGEVEVVVQPAEHRVAHRAADQGELLAGLGEPRARARRCTGATRSSSAATARCTSAIAAGGSGLVGHGGHARSGTRRDRPARPGRPPGPVASTRRDPPADAGARLPGAGGRRLPRACSACSPPSRRAAVPRRGSPPAAGPAPPRPPRPGRGRRRRASPLRVAIDSLDPACSRARARSRVTGTVTNVATQTWSDVKVYLLHLAPSPIDHRGPSSRRRRRPTRRRRRQPAHRRRALRAVDDLAPGETGSSGLACPRSRARRHRARASTGSACTRSAPTPRRPRSTAPTAGPAPSSRWSREKAPADTVALVLPLREHGRPTPPTAGSRRPRALGSDRSPPGGRLGARARLRRPRPATAR